jgi:hypothetical protein
MAKLGSLENMMAATLGQPDTKPTAQPGAPKALAKAKAASEARVAKLETPPVKEAAPVATATDKVTLYLPKNAYKFVKQTAVEMEKRPHDLLMEGVELMLAQYGKSLKDFRD